MFLQHSIGLGLGYIFSGCPGKEVASQGTPSRFQISRAWVGIVIWLRVDCYHQCTVDLRFTSLGGHVILILILFYFQEIKELKFEGISQEDGAIKCRYSVAQNTEFIQPFKP